ncbi:GNAT family N-acetyltransferase [Arthrobacter livingstonensis]|uniref:GNAT family N-acetyltransferase n=1 Tax=Arthrobacter livingstonensis TaxID=670078 RepID=A0A2V5LAN2_9MICC|nr:GNAT family N-acetyltransferase [Arthrobacter livingstonensis]PYI67832.1 GNAT family N-acetyltransferase [Arthrobacter livingstonensis]
MELTTQRLVLREYTPSDFAAVHAFASDPQTSTFVEWGPNSEQDTGEFLKFCAATAAVVPRTGHTLAITLAGNVIGSIGLTVQPRTARHGAAEAELGYTLHSDAWGRGYATEASRAIVEYGFSQLRLARITATCRPENVASAGVLRKLGMDQVGHLKNDRLIRGRWLDTLVFAIDADGASPDADSAVT